MWVNWGITVLSLALVSLAHTKKIPSVKIRRKNGRRLI